MRNSGSRPSIAHELGTFHGRSSTLTVSTESGRRFCATAMRNGCGHHLCTREGVACLPYYGLAKGFLTGKYRPGTKVDSLRAAGAQEYLDVRGLRVLDALDDIAAARHTTVAAVALAWLLAQPAVVSPIASARTIAQISELLPIADLRLTHEEVARLSAASSGE